MFLKGVCVGTLIKKSERGLQMLFPRGLRPNILNRGGGGGGADIKWNGPIFTCREKISEERFANICFPVKPATVEKLTYKRSF